MIPAVIRVPGWNHGPARRNEACGRHGGRRSGPIDAGCAAANEHGRAVIVVDVCGSMQVVGDEPTTTGVGAAAESLDAGEHGRVLCCPTMPSVATAVVTRVIGDENHAAGRPPTRYVLG